MLPAGRKLVHQNAADLQNSCLRYSWGKRVLRAAIQLNRCKEQQKRAAMLERTHQQELRGGVVLPSSPPSLPGTSLANQQRDSSLKFYFAFLAFKVINYCTTLCWPPEQTKPLVNTESQIYLVVVTAVLMGMSFGFVFGLFDVEDEKLSNIKMALMREER
jgi:hypothetical protein